MILYVDDEDDDDIWSVPAKHSPKRFFIFITNHASGRCRSLLLVCLDKPKISSSFINNNKREIDIPSLITRIRKGEMEEVSTVFAIQVRVLIFCTQ